MDSVTPVDLGLGGVRRHYSGKTGVMVDCDKTEFRLFNFSSIFNKTLTSRVIFEALGGGTKFYQIVFLKKEFTKLIV